MKTYDDVRNFLSCYFHQDWPLEGDSDEDIVSLFVHDASVGDVETLANNLEAVALKHENETSIDWLMSYGSYYDPTTDGLSGSAWLRRLVVLLRMSPNSSE